MPGTEGSPVLFAPRSRDPRVKGDAGAGETRDQGIRDRWEPAGSGGEAAGSGEMARRRRRRQNGAAGEIFQNTVT